MNLLKKAALLAVTLIIAVLLMTEIVYASESDNTSMSSSCSPQDIQGHLQYTGNHLSPNIVIGYFDNNAPSTDCPNQVTFHAFGSNQPTPEGNGWLESQTHVTSQSFSIPQGAHNYQVTFQVPEDNYCWYQIEATRTQEVKTPPYYSGEDMIDYVFVQGNGCVTPTPILSITPTASPSATPSPTSVPNTPTPAPSSNSSTAPTPTPAPGQVLSAATLANTGDFYNKLALYGIIIGTLLTIASLFMQFKKRKTVQ